MLIVIVSLPLLVVFTTCSKEKQMLLNNTWKVLYIETDTNYSILEESIRHRPITLSIIEMVNATDKFVFKLNSGTEIWGKVKIKNNKINFQNVETIDGLNSSFMQYFANLLGEIDRYETLGLFLFFTGNNEEKMKLVRDY